MMLTTFKFHSHLVSVRNLLVNLIDIDSRELVSSWIVRITATPPVAYIRKYEVQLSDSLETQKKILFKNPWPYRRKFGLASSDNVLMSPR